MSRLVASRGDVALCWANAARLQARRGDTEAAAQSRKVAAQVRGTNGWLRSAAFRDWRWR